MTLYYYWFSEKSAEKSRLHFANPQPKTRVKIKRTADGGVHSISCQSEITPIKHGSGYYTVACLETGRIFQYTERYRDPNIRPSDPNAVFVGEYNFGKTVLLQHKDGVPGRYQIGLYGFEESHITLTQATYLKSLCAAAKAPMPLISAF